VTKKKKLKSIPSLVKKASTLAQLWARLKDADSNGMVKCATCWKVGHYKEMQGGHFIERGKAATRLDQMNIHAQDPGCNLWGMKKASVILTYRQYLVERYGHEAILDLEERSKQVHKWNRIELEDLISELTDKTNEKLKEIT
jgi:hypothetical protein